MKVAFIIPYPIDKAPSQRFRFEQQLENLSKNDIEYNFFPFLTKKAFDILYKKGKIFSKLINILNGFLSRFLLMFKLKKYDFIFIHREASPIGPPIFEWIIAKVINKKIIYDFDDAIWLPNTSSVNNFVSHLKWHSKVKNIASWSYKISCGNKFLENFAKKMNKNTQIIPTTVDMEFSHNKTKIQDSKKMVIGWTGTHSTIQYLYDFEDILSEIQKEHVFDFMVISNKNPNFNKLKYLYVEWKKSTEILDLLNFNIGIMPLKDNQWAKGKCGFKAIQYMSLGIPAVVSNVGVNKYIVDNNENGFVCNTKEEWKNAIVSLITSQKTREEFGYKSQKKIRNNFSKNAVKYKYLELFDFSI